MTAVVLTRDAIAAGAILDMLRAAGVPDVWSDTEIDRSARDTLADRPPGDVWVFAYGSLIWNPAICFVERRIARVAGYHRRFCLTVERGRGSPEAPGLVLGLDRGGSVGGLVYRLAAGTEAAEFAVLWRREMVTGAYRPRWLKARTPEGPIRCLGFVIDRGHTRYAGRLGETEIAARIARAAGELGSGADYLYSTARQLHAHAIPCRALDRLADRVRRLAAAPGGDG